MKNVAILNFSTRKAGNCAHVGEFITAYHKDDQVKTFMIDNRIAPCGGCDYECLNPAAKCPNVSAYQEEVMQAVMQSDVTYMIVPNYFGMPCSNYYAYNERGVGFFNMDRGVMGQYMNAKKRFVIISNTETVMFDQAMRQQTKEEPDVIYLKTGKYGKRSTAGDILDSEAAQADLLAFLNK